MLVLLRVRTPVPENGFLQVSLGADGLISLQREDWDFTDVPDDAIVACCIWEYARESRTIATVAGLSWCQTRHIWHREDYKRDPALRKTHDKEAVIVEECAKREGFDYDRFFESLWKTDFPLPEIYESIMRFVRDGALPWQRLPRTVRDCLSKQLATSIVAHSLDAATVGELEELWKNNSAYLAKVRSTVRPKNDDSKDAAPRGETGPVESSTTGDASLTERLTVALTVDFSRFTDQEISAEFVRWLKENRPPHWKRPRRAFPGTRKKDRKLIEYRVAVERLGLMRLLHFHSPKELREQLPDAWKKYGAKERRFRREIREGCNFFRKLFPFLPEEERPASEERFGI